MSITVSQIVEALKILGIEKPRDPNFSRNELEQLFGMAADNCENEEMYPVNELYRCKPMGYFQNIEQYHNNIMEPYIKDNSGHPENNINGKLYGLFFSVNLNLDGSPRRKSYFGNMKFSISINRMLDPMFVHFYFADFYCNYNRHYVTIVVCKKETPVDKYCNQKLKRLQKQNPFFKVRTSTNTLFVKEGIELEFFYTECVDLWDGQLKPVQPMGGGRAYPGGLSNNKNCGICNF
uniref:PHYHIP_C domain-containing protein n=1 Tax=Panagrellus redivivus TaxID=6233 RepID=A0A7E4UNS8_PANRE